MKNKILLGSGIIAFIAGISGLFFADNVKNNNRIITIVSGIITIIGLGLTAKILDEELYPEDYLEDTEDIEEK